VKAFRKLVTIRQSYRHESVYWNTAYSERLLCFHSPDVSTIQPDL